jgi:acyl-CoA thioester hydrolase
MNGINVVFSRGFHRLTRICLLSSMEGYNTKLELRIDWSEMDLFAHVNNVSFFKYIQAARVNYWEKLGLNINRPIGQNEGPMLAQTTCQFKKPLHYPGSVSIYTKISFVKNTSFSIQHILVDQNNEVAAEAEDIVVYYDFGKNEKARIPDLLRDKIKLIEQKEF